MRILVTGANGLLATNTIKYLLELGFSVRGMIRDKKKLVLPTHPNLELVEGDILDLPAVTEAVKGCTHLIHIAGLTSQNLIDYKPYYKVNVVGTDNLLKAAIKFKLEKFIYVSSANTMGYGSKDDLGNENKPAKEPFTNAYYAKSKLEGQKKVLAVSDKIDCLSVNPTFMIGPYDAKPSSGKIILMSYNKKVLFYPPGGKNFVNVKDAVKGVIAALHKGKKGETYLLAGENLSYKEYFQKNIRKSGSQTLMIPLPKFLLLTVGYLGDIVRRLGVKTEVSSTNMKILCVDNFYTNRKAKEELGIEFQSIDKGTDEAIKWFKNNGKL